MNLKHPPQYRPTTLSYCSCLISAKVGVILAQLQAQLLSWHAIALAAVAILLLNCIKLPLARTIVLLASCALAGFSWTQTQAAYRLEQRLPIELAGKKHLISGQIVSLAQTNKYGQNFLLTPNRPISELAWKPALIQITVNQKGTIFDVGEYWQFSCKLKPIHGQINPSSFDLESWFIQRNISAQCAAKQAVYLSDVQKPSFPQPIITLEKLRQHLLGKVNHTLLDHPALGLIKALALGDQSQINAHQWWVFSQTGTTHLMSISGLHITMLAGLIATAIFIVWRRSSTLTSWISAPKAAALGGVSSATLYFLISGMAIPSQRTLIMLYLFTASLCWQLHIPLAVVWLSALAIIVCFDPFSVLSIGFWLSFLSVGVLIWACANRIHRDEKWRESLRSQWAANLAMLPILLVIFGQFPFISPLSNAIAIPIISLLVTPLALVGLVDPSGLCLKVAAELMLWCEQYLEWLLRLPNLTWQHSPPSLAMLPVALIGILLLLLPKGFPTRYLSIAMLLPLLSYTPNKIPEGNFRAVILDVGQGLAVLVQTREHGMLFDTGTEGNLERAILPVLRHYHALKLDRVIWSHNDLDHIGGAALLAQRWPIQHIQHSLPKLPSPLKPHQTQSKCIAGQAWQWNQVSFQILWPPDKFQGKNDNAQSCVLRVSTHSHSILITADIGKNEELQMLQRGLLQPSDILVVPHHGSKSSSSIPFVTHVQAKYAIFSAGFMNRFGHPKSDVVERYQAAQASSLITHQLGAIQFDVGNQIVLQSERQIHPHYWYTTLHK
ncbi:DNA internalization-related competence protein ComEC/Rec2 [Chitinibacter sp. SCUT-21]|uniref:DNA internalization-related competence protein ComEC/Rec2 n=1 Tax=Chitinibacter sp. SCUT-21 TaxID=2970891 RepID=UPI0035A6BFA2